MSRTAAHVYLAGQLNAHLVEREHQFELPHVQALLFCAFLKFKYASSVPAVFNHWWKSHGCRVVQLFAFVQARVQRS